MKQISLKEFEDVAELILDAMDDTCKDEWYGTEKNICQSFINTARVYHYSEEMKDAEEYQEYLRLKAKFGDK